ncbi:uncharacterized protein LY89DRAFT_748112 [Mollisia scopiformis]|uniref:Uncharacterized protein n=1 Tax=Mollisia scopiformis TaxID=149040 RepID=A0A194X9X4_MOLSC|nr:uncharacterized protein LY89DRAFT_748112 [Mollisia scopiformis]KUJ16934.1 hypothetical protein LY89DRAFT_748112 [Mollisia scopiformis]
MPNIFITAAPVGSMPRYLNPCEPKFIPFHFLQTHAALQTAISNSKGWEKCTSGGLLISQSTNFLHGMESMESDDQVTQFKSPFVRREIPASWFVKINSQTIIKKLVLHLTSHGWEAGDKNNLFWKHGEFVEAYIPPSLVANIRIYPGAIGQLLLLGWKEAGPGYYQHSKGTTPYLPITPDAIITESLKAALEGASIIHLHTRQRADMTTFSLPWSDLPITLGCQTNKIVVEDYEEIIPALRVLCPAAILNVSTSVRGGGDADGPTRRAHLKSYGEFRAPEICTMSPAEVLFQSGGGYQNSDHFLTDQLSSCVENWIRPEIEVFNHTILDKTLGVFKERLLAAGTPPILMLVAGIDQHRRNGNALEDDSLIPVEERKEIFSLLQDEEDERALEMAMAALKPIVDEIREKLPEAKISMLLPGLMHCLLARLAFKMSLDGVRIGLEDGLSVYDSSVPGGIRKGRTCEQVRNLREELQGLGFKVLTAEETRDVLDMPMSTQMLS